eukprot:1250678-Amphidinium_carterae.1
MALIASLASTIECHLQHMLLMIESETKEVAMKTVALFSPHHLRELSSASPGLACQLVMTGGQNG